MHIARNNAAKSRGFTLVELIVVLGVIAVLVVLAVPFVRSLLIDGKVPTTATDITKTVSKVRNNFTGQGVTPYSSLNTAGFANTGRGLMSSITILGTGTGATMAHDIGETGATVVVASDTITTAGDSFSVTLNKVNDTACPSLAAQLSKASEQIKINGTTVKSPGSTYNGATAGTACTTGDTNTFVFTFR